MIGRLKLNLNNFDRIFRFIGGLILTYATAPGVDYFDDQFFKYPVLAFGVFNVIFALVGWCPVYTLIGISSKKQPQE